MADHEGLIAAEHCQRERDRAQAIIHWVRLQGIPCAWDLYLTADGRPDVAAIAADAGKGRTVGHS